MAWLFSSTPFSLPASPNPMQIELPSTTKDSISKQEELKNVEQLDNMLKVFEGDQVPMEARTRTDVIQKVAKEVTLMNAWKYLPFLASQGE